MTDETQHHRPSPVIEEMVADFAISDAEANRLRDVLGQVAGLAHELPEPSDGVRVLLNGATPLRPRQRVALIAVAGSVLALGGVSAAAATNRLPDRVQEIVANATDGVLPVDIPHPVKPVNPPTDAPGHVRDDSDSDSDSDDSDEPKPSDSPKPNATTAPGQIQKATKPDPNDPGPARPADPGSHGRDNNADRIKKQQERNAERVEKEQERNRERIAKEQARNAERIRQQQERNRERLEKEQARNAEQAAHQNGHN